MNSACTYLPLLVHLSLLSLFPTVESLVPFPPRLAACHRSYRNKVRMQRGRGKSQCHHQDSHMTSATLLDIRESTNESIITKAT